MIKYKLLYNQTKIIRYPSLHFTMIKYKHEDIFISELIREYFTFHYD